MFETDNTLIRRPLNPPVETPSEQSRNPEAPEPQCTKPVPVSDAARHARSVLRAKATQKKSSDSEIFATAKERTARAVNDIRREFGQTLTREEALKLVSLFRAGVVPRRRAGRRPKPQITAAYQDWKAGMRGVALFRKHIPGWKDHNRYHRIGEQKTLMDAIRSRYRRERDDPCERVHFARDPCSTPDLLFTDLP